MNPLLPFVAPRLVCLTDIIGVAKGRKPSDLYVKSTIPGGGGGDLWFRSDGKGVHVQQSPVGPGLVTWAELADVIRAGVNDDLLAKATARYGFYVDVCMEPHATWENWPTDSVHQARLHAHQRRYSRAVDAMRAIEQQVVARGLAALNPTPTLFDLMEAS